MNKERNLLTSIQEQYLGYSHTPKLWVDDSIYKLKQFQDLKNSIFKETNIPTRLGKRIEHFVFHDINKDSDLNLMVENLQIQQDKQTIGEIDALLLVNNQPVHLEVIYKFYLYDPQLGPQELNCWIGPNRNDSLLKKLDKLKNKQLPLLRHPQTQPYLKDLDLKPSDIEQQVLFKAQLFLPETLDALPNTVLNNACIVGSYMNKQQLLTVSHCQFYMPTKLEWLIEAHDHVSWQSSDLFFKEIEHCFNRKQSPMIWIRYPDLILKRCFVVWW